MCQQNPRLNCSKCASGGSGWRLGPCYRQTTDRGKTDSNHNFPLLYLLQRQFLQQFIICQLLNTQYFCKSVDKRLEKIGFIDRVIGQYYKSFDECNRETKITDPKVIYLKFASMITAPSDLMVYFRKETEVNQPDGRGPILAQALYRITTPNICQTKKVKGKQCYTKL